MLSIPRLRLSNKILFSRSIHAGRVDLISEKAFQKFKLNQVKMQRNSDCPTYLVCGARDKMVYYALWAVVACCTIANIKNLYKLKQQY